MKNSYLKISFLLITVILTLMWKENSWALYEDFQVLKQKGDCVYVNYNWTGTFYEGGYRGWICPERHARVSTEAMLREHHAYLDNPANKDKILAERLQEVDAYQSLSRNPWKKECAEHVKSFYSAGLFDYRYPIEYSQEGNRKICEGINNSWSGACLNDILSFEYSAVKSEFQHNRVSAIVSCGQIDTEEKMKFYNFLKKWFVDLNTKYDRLFLMNGFFVSEAKYIKNQFNRECLELVLSVRDGIGDFAKVCNVINTPLQLHRVKRLIREKTDVTEKDISSLAQE